MMKTLIGAALSAVAIIAAAVETELWKPGGEPFAVNEFRDGVLHLKDDTGGRSNNRLYRRFTGKELTPYRGRRVVFSARIRQLAASRANSVGLTLDVKARDGRTVYRSARIPVRGVTEWMPYSVTSDIPPDAVAFGASLDCANGYGGTAEALFAAVRLEPAGEEAAWNTGTGQLIRLERNPLFWRWNAAPGVRAELDKTGLAIASPGRVVLAPADGKPVLLAGSTPDRAELKVEVAEAVPFRVEFLSFGKSNRTVEVVPSADKTGGGRAVIPLERFGPFHDLASWDGLAVIADAPLTIRSVTLSGLDRAAEVVNLLPDPSFEEGTEPAVNFNLWGDYRPEITGKGFRYDGNAFHGKRSLRIEPGGFFSWFAHDMRGKGAVFSAWLRGERAGKAELLLQNMVMDHHGAAAAPVVRGSVTVGTSWERRSVHCPLAGKMSAVDFDLYRAEIRNTGTEPIWIDAVQLEQDFAEPRPFSPVRGSKYHYKIAETVSLEQYPGMRISANTRQGEVVLKVAPPPPQAVPVRGGVPFPAGEFFDASEAELLDRNGKTVPAQFTVLARRPRDGSILSLAVDFQAADAGPFRLRYGRGIVPAAKRRPLAEEREGRIRIDTGALQLTLTPDKPSFLENGDAFFAVKTPDGKIHRSAATLAKLEENGPERCTVFLHGDAFLAWELRLTAFRNQPYLEIDCSFENNFTGKDPLYKLVRSIYLQLPGGARYQLDGESGAAPAEFVQRLARTGRFTADVAVRRDGREAILPGRRLSGEARSGKARLRIDELYEQSPRGFGFEPGAVKLMLWPEAGVNPLDVAAGLSGTMRLWYAPDGGALPPARRPLLQPPPDWVRKSGVFGDFLTREEAAAAFPRSAAMIDRVFDAARNHAAVTGMFGFADYGDFGTRNFYRNHETSGVRNLWTRYLSSGDPRDFALAESHSRHMRDIDQCHIRRGATAVHPHNSWSNLTYNFHTGHFWVTGVVWHYLLTGDRRSLESALSSAAVLVQKSAIRYKAGRERHRMIFHLAELYELSGDPQLRAAFERQYGWGGASDADSYYGGIAHEALAKLYEVTGDARYLERLDAEAAGFRRINSKETAPMPPDRTAPPTRSGSANEGRAAMMLFAGAMMARRSGDPGYLTYLNRGDGDPLLWHLLAGSSRDNSLAWALPYLAAMRQFGLRENPAMPERYGDLNRLAGRMQIGGDRPFELELTPGPDGMAVLDLYRIRSFRYWQFKRTDDRLSVVVTDRAGRKLAGQTLYANDVAEHRRITVPVPGGEPVLARVTFHNDCWGGVGSPNPYRIRADRWFGTRTTVMVPLVFTIRAPKSGRLAVDWRWKNARNSRSGEPLAVSLETPEGEPVVREIHILEAEQPETNGNSFRRTELEIPAEFCGKLLRLSLPDLKWIEWKLDGLDDPYFYE